MTVIEQLESLVPRYHVKLEQPGDSGNWWCWIGEWSNTEPTEWIAVHNGRTIEEAVSNAVAKLESKDIRHEQGFDNPRVASKAAADG